MAPIKFLQIFPFYENYLKGFYIKHPEIETLDYKNHQDGLMSDCFGTANFWIHNLNKLGNYNAQAIVYNDIKMQTKWANENSFSFDTKDWVLQILEAQINDLKPEVVFWNDCMFPNQTYFTNFKKKFPSVKLLIGWDGVALNNPEIFKHFDIVLTCAQFIVDFYKSFQINSYFVPFGFEANIIKKLEEANLKKIEYEISFCGSLNKGPHLSRYNTILGLIKAGLPLDVFSDAIFRKDIYNIHFVKQLVLNKHKELLDERLMMDKIQPSVYGLEMFNIVKNSKLSLNIHIDKARNEAGNMRLFEATGIGSCMITDWKESLSAFFKIDEEVVVFKSVEEAKDKINNLLRDDALRNKIAKAGQKRTLKDYSFSNKVNWLDKTIQNHLNN